MMTSEAVEAVETVLTVHDGLQKMVREEGMPADALSHTGQAFIEALKAIGFDVVQVAPEPPTGGKTICSFDGRPSEPTPLPDDVPFAVPVSTAPEPGLRAAEPTEHVDVVAIGEAATSALDELDNVRWDDIWARVDASDTEGDGLAHDSRKYVSYVRGSIEEIIAALTALPNPLFSSEYDDMTAGEFRERFRERTPTEDPE